MALGAQAVSPAPDASLSTDPAAMGIGDTNGDGYGDLVVLTTGASIHVFAGGPNGVAGRTQNLNTPGGANDGGSLVVVDMDGDGYDDAALTYKVSYYGNTVRMQRGGPNGLLAAVAWSDPLDGQGPPTLAAGDHDGDGFGDVVACRGETYTASGCNLYLGDATGGGPVARVWFGSGYWQALHAVLTDFDGDGQDEVVIEESGRLSVYPFSGQRYTLAVRGYSLAGADFDGDGFGDLWVDERIVPGTPAGAGAAQRVFPAGSLPVVVASPDVDGDGAADLIAADPSQGVGPYAAAGVVGVVRSGSILPPAPGPWVSRGAAQEQVGGVLAAGDLDGDGFGDRAFSTVNGTVAVVYGP